MLLNLFPGYQRKFLREKRVVHGSQVTSRATQGRVTVPLGSPSGLGPVATNDDTERMEGPPGLRVRNRKLLLAGMLFQRV